MMLVKWTQSRRSLLTHEWRPRASVFFFFQFFLFILQLETRSLASSGEKSKPKAWVSFPAYPAEAIVWDIMTQSLVVYT